MNLAITAFEVMAEIAEDNKIKSIKWAEASGLSPSRISDFKRLAKKTKAGAAEPDLEHDVWKHTFSLHNFSSSWDGLKRMVGATALRKGLMRQLEMKKVCTRVRSFQRLMTFNDGQLKLVDSFSDAVLHQIHTSSKPNES